ncbi:MAG: M60 family metallopeptidase, partial [Nitrospinaceae bacterium]|nr:M60 family metallopeptidase [Nitrospinaceae bacterium]
MKIKTPYHLVILLLCVFSNKANDILAQGTGDTYMSAFEFNGNTQDSAGDYKIELEEKITFGGGVEKESLDLVGDAWVKVESKLNDKLFENDKCRIKLRFKTLNSADGDSGRRFIFGIFNQREPGGSGGDWDVGGYHSGDRLALALDLNGEGDEFQFVAEFGNQSINFAALKSFSAQTWHDIDIILNLGTEHRSAIFTLDGTIAKIELEDDYNIEALKEHLQKQSFYIGVDPVQISTTGQDEVYDGIHDPSETNISIDYLKFQFQDQSTLVGDSEVIRDLLVKFTQYVSGALDLSNDQQKALIVAYSLEWDGSYEQVKTEVSNYLAAFDASRQVLFSKTRAEIDPRTMGYPEQLAFNLRQWIHDELFKIGNISAVAGVNFPSAEVFPGLPKNGAPRVASVDVSVNGSYVSDKAVGNEDARHAIRLTGFYAAPGEVITLEFDSSSVGKGLNIVVGAHIFDTEGRQKFNRFPRVSKTFPVTSASVDVANPFGGSLMIEVPDGVELGEINVKIKNAINAPFYSTRSARKTTTQEWNEDLSNAYVPWIELESDKFIVIAPMSLYQGGDPATILSEWDNIMDAFSIVGGRPLERSRGEGVLVDSMLFMGGTAAPASYPINVSTDVYYLGADRYVAGTHFDVWSNPFNPKPSDTDTGRSKFIVLHELGHRAMYPQLWEEHETNVNLPAVAAYNLTYGMDLTTEAFEHSIHQRFTMDEAAVDWMISPNFRGNKRMGFDLVDFEGTEGQELRYQSRGHAKYVDIAYLFGWDEFSKIHKVFYEMGRIMGRRITALVDARERDDYYIRVASIALNRNLSPLFHFWGIIPSEELVRELSVLPTPEMIKTRLEHYKTLIPANNSEFVSHYTSSGAPDAHQKIRYDNLSKNYNENLSDSIVFQIDVIIAKYFESNKSAPEFTEDPSYKSYPVGESFSLTLGVEDSDTPQNRLSFLLVVNSGIRDMSMLPEWFKFNEQTGEISGVSEKEYQTPELSIVVSDVAHTVYSGAFKIKFYEPDIDDPEGWPIWQNGGSKDITVYEGESYLHEINLVTPLGFPYPYDLRFAKLPEWNPLAPFYHVNDWILPGWMVQDEGKLYLYPTSDLIGVHKYFLHFLDGAQPFKITVAPNDSSILLHGTPPEEIFATEPFSFIPDLILGKQFVAIGGGSVERSLNLVTKSPIAPNLLIEKKHVPTNVSFSVENLPVWAHLDQKTGEIFGTPFYNQLGDFKNIKITAVSGDEMATLPAFDIKVVFRDDDPQISIVPKLSAYAGVEFRYDLDVKTLSERNQNHTFASELPIWIPYQLNEFFKSDDGQIKYRRDSSANTMPSWLSLDGDQWYISGRPLLSDVGVHEGIELTFRFRADSGPGIDKMYFSPVSVFTIEVFDDPTKQPPS